MDRIVQFFTLLLQFGWVRPDCCYYSGFYCYYCAGYCYGYTYGYQYCDNSYVYYTSGGVIAGAVIGSLIGLGLLITCIVFTCAACNKSGSQRGRVVQPTTGVSVVHSSQANTYYGAQPSAPYASYPQPAHNAPYPPPQNAAYPPPNQNYGVQPPNYSAFNQEPPPPIYKQ